MTSHGTGEGPRGFEAVQEPVSAPPKPSERAACRATPQGSVSAQRQYPKTGHGFAPQSINMRQGAFLARFPLWRLWRKISNWEKYHYRTGTVFQNGAPCETQHPLSLVSVEPFFSGKTEPFRHYRQHAGHDLGRSNHQGLSQTSCLSGFPDFIPIHGTCGEPPDPS